MHFAKRGQIISVVWCSWQYGGLCIGNSCFVDTNSHYSCFHMLGELWDNDIDSVFDIVDEDDVYEQDKSESLENEEFVIIKDSVEISH